MQGCIFCEIAAGRQPAAEVLRTDRLVVFADHRPIRPGHVQIVPLRHVAVFDALPADLAAEIVWIGQRLARALKRLHPVDRVGFAFTGNEVAHVHAHVLPLFAADDITSARYSDGTARVVGRKAQADVAAALRGALQEEPG